MKYIKQAVVSRIDFKVSFPKPHFATQATKDEYNKALSHYINPQRNEILKADSKLINSLGYTCNYNDEDVT